MHEHGTGHEVSYLIHYYSLLQNVTDLLQNAIASLLQNASVFYYKIWHCHYKMRQLLKDAKILLQIATVITKCDVCYKLRQYSDFCKHIKNIGTIWRKVCAVWVMTLWNYNSESNHIVLFSGVFATKMGKAFCLLWNGYHF